jgi:5'-phosphate synthase pdxT subunit
MKIGVLALQGAFREHREVFTALGAECVEVRKPEHLGGIDAVVLPGGESTTMSKLLVSSGVLEPLRDRIRDGVPVFATCAGVILLAADVLDGRADQVSLGGLDVAVRRNGYGSQRQSFETDLRIRGLGGGDGQEGPAFQGVFIRAPVVERVGEGVEVLAECEGRPVLVRSGPVWGATFHPELSGDLRLHACFLRESV